ncbi:MAG: hypothetical protein NPMRTH1_480005 [Nitrosopumilales archaeon]|nr:MAG: hypothetical protein NPMRTH1_480005 [Nitrosopumilales archaeon]
MSAIQTTQKKNSQLVPLALVGIGMLAIVGYVMIYVAPIGGLMPLEITEDVEILAVTEKGVVFETSTGIAVVTDQYDGEPGDVIEITYSVPVKYLDDKQRQQASFDAFNPDP